MYNYNFDEDDLVKIIENALKEGYSLRFTEWLNNMEREEGIPSVDYVLDEEDYKDYKEDVYSILPEENKYGCGELNFVKDDEYICFYHIERGDEYINNKAYSFIYEYKYFEIYVNDKITNAYSIFIDGYFKDSEDVINFCKDNNLFTEEDDYKYIEYINEISKETFKSATDFSKRLEAFNKKNSF